MKNFRRVLIAMDLSEMDAHILKFTSFLGDLLSFQKLYFVHIMRNFSAPDHLDAEFHKLFAPEYPIDEKVRDKIALDVQEVFGDKRPIEIAVDVLEGKPYEKLIHWTEVKEIDLLVVGHKEISKGSGVTAKRVARKSKCNVLFVPETAEPALEKILAPTDFSDNSTRAIKQAIRLRNQIPELKIETVYVVDLPPDSYYIESIENKGFKNLLLEAAQETYAGFLAKRHIDPGDLNPVFLENDYVNIAAHLEEYVRKSQPDLVIMGAKGHTLLENFLYGSVAEKFVDRCKSAPILIIR